MTITSAHPYRCKHCPASTASTLDVARAMGWRFFTGKTLGGEDLEDIVCPVCAGNAEPPEVKPSWRVGCSTCDWEFEDEYNEGPLSAKDAKDMARAHVCGPEVWIAPPSGDKHYDPLRVNDDGSFR